MPKGVFYQTVDIEYANERGYKIDDAPTFMVFVDRKLRDTETGLLEAGALHAFLTRWGFRNNNDEPEKHE